MTPPGRVLTGLAALSLFAACSSGTSADGGHSSNGQPSANNAAATEATVKAPDGLAPIDPPAGFTEVDGDGFRLYAPAPFTRANRTSSSGEPMLVLAAAGMAGGRDQPTVGVVRDVKPRAGALEQSRALESAKRLVDEATAVRRTVVSWPGAREAVIVQWTVQKRRTGSNPTPQINNVQLFTQVDDDLILSVVAVAPAESFDQSQVTTVLRTFRPTGAAS